MMESSGLGPVIDHRSQPVISFGFVSFGDQCSFGGFIGHRYLLLWRQVAKQRGNFILPDWGSGPEMAGSWPVYALADSV